MTTPSEFLCGPTQPSGDPDDGAASIGRIPRDRLTVEDRAAVDHFRGFLAGDLFVCPSCMEPDDECRPDARCCPGCPGIHITTKAKRVMGGAS